MLPGVPFPIPKSGFEAMWNHLVRYTGVAYNVKYENWNVDSAGVASLATSGNLTNEYPLYDPKRTDTVAKENDPYFKLKLYYTGPARRAGEALMAIDSVNPIVQPRRAWQYLPGQRRVKLAPDLSYDTPNAGTAGARPTPMRSCSTARWTGSTSSSSARRKCTCRTAATSSMYAKDVKPALTPNHLNPDHMRWELHRVWVVEATLKAGQRDLYSKRAFYLDEDSWVALAADQYDAKGQLYRSTFRQHDVQLRRRTRSTWTTTRSRTSRRAHTLWWGRPACLTACATSSRCPICNGRRKRWPAPAYVRRRRKTRRPGRDAASEVVALCRLRVRGIFSLSVGPFPDFRIMNIRAHRVVALALALTTPLPALAAGFVDVLATPAPMSPLASKALMQGAARAGDRLVAVGQRGHIVVSNDGGATWQQSPVPVSSDLTAVYFVNDKKGWAVGHDGVILATSDGGATWALQLDGKRANEAVLADLERKAAAQPTESLKAMLAEAKRNQEQGADKPFLDVWFADEKTGYVVGAYNLIFQRTTAAPRGRRGSTVPKIPNS